jgi:uncharacterized protein
MTIVLTGGSGFVGTALTKTLLAKGHTVIVIDTRSPALMHKDLFFIPCDLDTSTLPFNVLERTDAVIHLAGNHVAPSSTATNSIKNLIKSLEQTTAKPSIFITASSVGYYGDGLERELDERSGIGATDMARMIEAQEKEALEAERFGSRVVIVRTAPVIGEGGFITPLLRAARLHVTFRLTKKDFWMPWIHLNDLIHIYMFALETNTLQGIVNAATPQSIKYSEFLKTFKKTTKSIVLPKPKFIQWPYRQEIRATMINQKIVPQRLLDKGFAFAYANIREAIEDVASSSKRRNEKN